MTRAQQLEKAVADLLATTHHPVWRVSNYRCFRCGQVQNASARGLPDFLVPGMCLAVECKTGKGRITPEQAMFRDEWQTMRGTYIEARDNVDAVIAFLETRKKQE